MNTNKPIGRNFANKTGNTVQTGYHAVRNTAQKTYTRFRGSSTFVQVVTVLFILVVITVLVMWVMHLYDRAQYSSKESPFIITDPVNAFNRSGKPVKRQRVPYPVDGLAFTYSFWMYVSDWNYNFGKWKNIFIKGNDDRRAPGLWLYPKTNSLHARINTHADYNEGCDVRNIPLQKWVHIVYVLNNRTVDIYVDGKLERSCVLRGVPVLNNDPVSVAEDGGFYGQLAKMQYFTRPLMPEEIVEMYSEGPYLPKRYSVNIFGKDKKKSHASSEMEDEYM
jgi:hypothetical protein